MEQYKDLLFIAKHAGKIVVGLVVLTVLAMILV